MPSVGYLANRANQPAHLQVRNTITAMDMIKGENDIRNYSRTARNGLFDGGEVKVMAWDGTTIIGVAPKLALVVVSSDFRQFFKQDPAAASVKVSHASVDQPSVAVLLDWVNTIVRSNGKFGIRIPNSNVELIKVRYAAQMLGMNPYVTHFVKAYKDDLHTRIPPTAECTLIEQCTANKNDELVNAIGARLAYLRRKGTFKQDGLNALNSFLEVNEKIRDAVQAADARAGFAPLG